MKKYLATLWRTLKFSKNLQLRIMRFAQDQFLVGVTGVIFDNENRILLFKHTYRQTQWSLPGGYIKGREHPEEGLEREIEEESGLTVSADQSLKIRTDRESARLDVFVVGKFIGGEFRPSSEVSEYGFFTPGNLPAISKNQLLMIDQAIQMRSGKTV